MPFGHVDEFAAVGAAGVCAPDMVMLLFTGLHPGVLSLTVTVYVPVLFTTMDAVVSPVFQAYV